MHFWSVLGALISKNIPGRSLPDLILVLQVNIVARILFLQPSYYTDYVACTIRQNTPHFMYGKKR